MVPKITIIVPIYNVEHFIEKCIRSIINQSFREIEVILVDDGSTDKSGNICDEFASSDSRIIVIHKENAGLGYARNTGLEIAKGKFVSFIDSDDWVDLCLYEKVVNFAEKENAEMIEFGLRKIDFNNISTNLDFFSEKKLVFDKDDIINIVFPSYLAKGKSIVSSSVCTHLYLRNIINHHKIRFYCERDIYTEDYLFNLKYLWYCNKLVIINELLYNYRNNDISLTKSYRPKYLEAILNRNNIVFDFIKEIGKYDEYEKLVIMRFAEIAPSFVFNEFKRYKKVSNNEIISELKYILTNQEIHNALKYYNICNITFKKRIIIILMKNGNYFIIFLILRILRFIGICF